MNLLVNVLLCSTWAFVQGDPNWNQRRGDFSKLEKERSMDDPPVEHPPMKAPMDEESINHKLPQLENLYQGDIALTKEEQRTHTKSRFRRATINNQDWQNSKKWDPNHIPYYFDASMPTLAKTRVREVMDYWEKYTCVRFKEDRTSQPTLRIFQGKGCWSYIGRQKIWKEQDLSIGKTCDNNFGVVAHELMHALGFYHEHARPDRNNYINIDMANVHPNDTENFEIDKCQDTQGFAYEYGSVMHYASTYMGMDSKKPVFISKDPNFSTTMGQRMRPTFQDIQQVNDRYKCWMACDNSGTECGNGGVANVNNCKECICPNGFGGNDCFGLEKPSPRNADCGGIIQAEIGKRKTLKGSASGMNDRSNWFRMPDSCWWHIKAPEGKRIAAKLTAIDTVQCDVNCAYSYIEIKTGNFKQTGYRLCCPQQTQVVYNSTGKTMAVGINVLLYTTTFELEYMAY